MCREKRGRDKGGDCSHPFADLFSPAINANPFRNATQDASQKRRSPRRVEASPLRTKSPREWLEMGAACVSRSRCLTRTKRVSLPFFFFACLHAVPSHGGSRCMASRRKSQSQAPTTAMVASALMMHRRRSRDSRKFGEFFLGTTGGLRWPRPTRQLSALTLFPAIRLSRLRLPAVACPCQAPTPPAARPPTPHRIQ